VARHPRKSWKKFNKPLHAAKSQMNTVKHSVSYNNAEVRGRLRQWKKKLVQDYAVFDRALETLSPNGKPGPLIVDMVKCTRAGRKQAFDKINKAFGPGVTLESASLGKNNRSLAIWSILKPRSSVAIAVPEDISESERASLAQDCVTLNYIIVGCVADVIQVAEGMWTLEVPDHALGRAVERSGFLHPGVLIREAHSTLLNLPEAVFKQPNFTDRTSSGAYIKAGPGCFAGYFHVSEDVSRSGYSASVRVRTWLDEDQLFERQIVLCEKGKPGQRLGDSVLKPSPLCRFERDESGRLQVRTWGSP
jgi:hypothetical protein